MSTIRAVLVEDEPSGMENLRWKIENNCPEVSIVAECTNGNEAISALRRYLPDLVFLDIQLGDMSGFDVLKAVRHPSFNVIFTTSHDQYAIEAIKNNALDYLLKPVEVEELQEAVAKARYKQMQQPAAAAPPPAAPTTRYGFPITTGQQFIELDRIIYAQAEDNVAVLYLDDKSTVRLTRSLGWLEEELEPNGFCRVHHSYVINLHLMREYIRNEGGYIVMQNGKAISISRRRKDHFLQALDRHNLNP